MSEPIWCNFDMRVPAAWYSEEKPLWVVGALGDALLNGSTLVDLAEGNWEIHANGEGNYGLHDDDLETVFEWCHANRVPYVAHDESKYDCQGEIRVYAGGDEYIEGRFDQTVVLDSPTYDRITKGKDADFPTVDDYFAKLDVNVGELSIDHLPAEPPIEDEGE